MTRQIRFNGKKSYEDFKIRIISATVAEPKKREIKVTVPYRNGSIDLSDYDGNFYFDDTEVSYKMFVSDTEPVTLLRRIEKIKSWLCEAHGYISAEKSFCQSLIYPNDHLLIFLTDLSD